MTKKAYIGVGDQAKKVSKMYVGVGDTAKKVKRAYVGDDSGKAKLFYSAARTFAGRNVYRHETLPGSVIEYNEFGTAKNLLVVDAAYRGTAQWRTSNTDIPGINNWPHYYAPTCTGNVIDSTTGYVDLRSIADLISYESKLTDAHFQSALTATLAPVIQTAKEATDLMIADGNCPAAQFCRSQSVSIEMQLPNIYQALVMYAMGDVIDSLDPTLAANADKALGKYTNTYRWFSGDDAWSSTAHSSANACLMYSRGRTNGTTKTYTYSVAPVAELA